MDGILLINKEKEYTSNDVVCIVKKILKEKVGHTGTLDPNATGLLPLLIGKGTKLSKYLINHDKTYEVTLKLGKQTDTADIEGKVILEKDVPIKSLDEHIVEEVLKMFIGKQKQLPPMYSAIKVNGKKLYEYARNGENVEVKERDIEIYNINLTKIDKENKEIFFTVFCSKGTYIRSLCEDISRKLDTVGFMKELNRTRVGGFYLENAITIGQLKDMIEEKSFNNIITVEEFFKSNQEIYLDSSKLKMFLNGVKLNMNLPDGLYKIYSEDSSYIGIGKMQNYMLKRDLCL